MKRLRSLGSMVTTVVVTLLAGSLFYEGDPTLLVGIQESLDHHLLDLGHYLNEASMWQLGLSGLGLISGILWMMKAGRKGGRLVSEAKRMESVKEQYAFDRMVRESRAAELSAMHKMIRRAGELGYSPHEFALLMSEMFENYVSAASVLPDTSLDVLELEEDDDIEELIEEISLPGEVQASRPTERVQRELEDSRKMLEAHERKLGATRPRGADRPGTIGYANVVPTGSW